MVMALTCRESEEGGGEGKGREAFDNDQRSSFTGIQFVFLIFNQLIIFIVLQWCLGVQIP